jgi:hypothetical protein
MGYKPASSGELFATQYYYITVPCEITGFMDQSYGKYPQDFENQLIMEYAFF